MSAHGVLRSIFMSGMVNFRRPDGETCSGFYVEPAGGTSAPGIVVIQEWWGVNDQIKGVAQKLADAGYRALVPDLYRGKVGVDAEEAGHLMNQLDFVDAASQDIRGAVTHLKAAGSKVAVTGFCMGGALSLLSATKVPELDAVVCFYGMPPLDFIDASQIKAPIQGHFATKDAFFDVKNVDLLDQKLKQANVAHEFYKYDAMHAFANETAIDMPIPIKYDAAASQLAWQRTLDFLQRVLLSLTT
jgi:carboxymethylenebutenolidase